MKRLALLLAAALAIMLALGATFAAATRTVKYPSAITIGPKGQVGFHGDVVSLKSQCESGRRVTLKIVTSGGPDRKIGSTTTNRQGFWKIPVQGFAGVSLAHFRAHVNTRRDGTAGTIYVCKPAYSRQIMLGG